MAAELARLALEQEGEELSPELAMTLGKRRNIEGGVSVSMATSPAAHARLAGARM